MTLVHDLSEADRRAWYWSHGAFPDAVLGRTAITLYECVGCGQLHRAPVAQCDCQKNPDNLFQELVAKPKQVAVPSCPSCCGSDAPCDQVDCESVPCMVGRPRTRDAEPIKGMTLKS
jgi:hypothetical protein